MSKQLAISAAFSAFAMSAFVLFGTGEQPRGYQPQQTGAAIQITAPALDRTLPALPIIGR